MRIARWVLTPAVVVSPVALTACDSPNSRSDVMAPSPAELSEEARFRAGADGMFDGDSIYYHRVYAGRILEDGSVAIAVWGAGARVILLDSVGGLSAVVGRQGSPRQLRERAGTMGAKLNAFANFPLVAVAIASFAEFFRIDAAKRPASDRALGASVVRRAPRALSPPVPPHMS